MAIRAVVFDIGGVLELDVIELVDIGLDARWELRLRNVASARALGIHAIHCRETEQAIADVQACLREYG
jgi:hypothetical protein